MRWDYSYLAAAKAFLLSFMHSHYPVCKWRPLEIVRRFVSVCFWERRNTLKPIVTSIWSQLILKTRKCQRTEKQQIILTDKNTSQNLRESDVKKYITTVKSPKKSSDLVQLRQIIDHSASGSRTGGDIRVSSNRMYYYFIPFRWRFACKKTCYARCVSHRRVVVCRFTLIQ